MLLNLYLNANFDGVLRSSCLQSMMTNQLQKHKVATYSQFISIFEGLVNYMSCNICKYA